MKIAYFGLPLGALLLLERGFQLAPVVLTALPAPGRRRLKRVLTKGQVFDMLAGASEAAVEAKLSQESPALLLSWFWSRKLPERWLRIPALGAYGLHPSLLPRHRGPNPYFAAIDAGDVVTGVTLHRLAADYDSGDIIESEELVVGERDSWQLARALDRPSLRLLVHAAELAACGKPLQGTRQLEHLASWAPEPTGDRLRVDWNWSSSRVLRRIRALAPVPGLALELRGVRFFVTQAVAVTAPLVAEPGEAIVLEERVLVRTADGAIAIRAAVLADSGGTLNQSGLASLLAEGTLEPPEDRVLRDARKT